MPPRSAEEKERRRRLQEEKKAARKAAKELKEKEEAKKQAALLKLQQQREAAVSGDVKSHDGSDDICYIVTLPEDAQTLIMCFLPARDLGAFSMACRTFNYSLDRVRISHFFTRVNAIHKFRRCDRVGNEIGRLQVPVQFCTDENDVRDILHRSIFGSGDTGRLVSKKSKQSSKKKSKTDGSHGDAKSGGDADEYIAYARFIEEAIVGNAIQQLPGQKPYLLVSFEGLFFVGGKNFWKCTINIEMCNEKDFY